MLSPDRKGMQGCQFCVFTYLLIFKSGKERGGRCGQVPGNIGIKNTRILWSCKAPGKEEKGELSRGLDVAAAVAVAAAAVSYCFCCCWYCCCCYS